MKRLLLIATIAAAMMATTTGHATNVYNGTILVPSQANAFVGEFANTCGSTSGRLNGIDSYWFTVTGGHDLELRAVTEGADFDAYFWDANCNWIPDTSMASDGDEYGKAPANAAYIMVKLYWGVNAEFVLITTPPAP